MNEKFRIGVSRDVITADGGTMFGPEAMKLLEHPAVDWEFLPEKVAEITPAHAARYDALCLLTARVTRDTLAGIDRKLKLIARFGVGYDSIDVAACTEQGVLLTITPDGVRRPVAASVMAYVLALAHRMVLKDRLVRDGRWAEKGDFLGMGLMGRTLGVIGVGNIGREVLKLARPFDLKLIGHDPYVSQADVRHLDVTMTDLDTLLATSDFVSVNCLLDDRTRGLIGAAQFARMKPSAYFINTSRGPVVDEAALVEALRERRIRGAAIDVFEKEPTPVDNPLLAFDNVIVAPHAICHTDECMRMLGEGAFRSAVTLAEGRKPAHIVNPQALVHPGWAGVFHA
jgi:phosphoglycerate dehydrogenase-like enzyme